MWRHRAALLEGRRGVPGGYSLLGTTGRLRPGDVITGKAPAPCEVLLLSSALYRRCHDYAAPAAGPALAGR